METVTGVGAENNKMMPPTAEITVIQLNAENTYHAAFMLAGRGTNRVVEDVGGEEEEGLKASTVNQGKAKEVRSAAIAMKKVAKR